MKKIMTSIVLAMSGFVATAAMAAPNHHDNHASHRAETVKTVKVVKKEHAGWRVGQSIPRQYQHSRYAVDYHAYNKLSKPGRYQKWYKVNGQYMLINQQNHTVIKIIR